MYTKHPAFNAPPNESKLWRYFDFAKLLSLIVRKELFFASLTLLRQEDPLEGYWSRTDFKSQFQDAYATEWEVAKAGADQLAKITFVNCWHLNEHESTAMWKLYGEQFAVQTTFERLIDSFVNDEVFAGTVRYIDFATERIHIPDKSSEFVLAMTKDKSYEHEKEVRIILADHPKKSEIFAQASSAESNFETHFNTFVENYPYSGKGVSVAVDVDTLIESIYVSPILPIWYAELLRKLLEDYGHGNIPVRFSKIGVLE